MEDTIVIPDSPPVAARPMPASIGVIDITDSGSEGNLAADAAPTMGGQNEADLSSQCLAQVLEIVPDVLPEHALGLVKSYHQKHKDNVLELVLHELLEGHSYPKVEKGKGKRKREEDEANERRKSRKFDYGNKDRPKAEGANYRTLALDQLYLDFPYIPVNHVRRTLSLHNELYAPTYLSLRKELKSGNLSYKVKVTPSRSTGKGKSVEKQDDQFQEERAWILLRLQEETAANDAKVAEQLNEKEYEDSGDGIECGCCFTPYPFDKMIQCPDAHLFCMECMTSYSSNLLGSHNSNIICMDQSGCKLPFLYSELRRFLTPKLLDLYDRVKQAKDIAMAGLENLEECPHCEFKVVIDNPAERLFRCQNRDCEAVTCRECKKPDHLPKSCKEVEQDTKLDARHVIEEAMTRALMRNCPKCQKAIVKEMGCNKMCCPCGTLFCYICRKIIKGYDHYEGQRRGQPDPTNSTKCPLYDPAVEQRHSDEVAAAAKKAIEEFKRDHPDVDEKDLQVDLRKAPAAGPSNRPLQPPQLAPPQIPPPRFVPRHQDPRMVEWVAAMQRARMPLPPGPMYPPPAPVQYNFNLNFGGAAQPGVHHAAFQPPMGYAGGMPAFPFQPPPQPPPQQARRTRRR